MSTVSLAIACEQALSGALEVGNGALLLSSPLQPPTSLLKGYTQPGTRFIFASVISETVELDQESPL